MIDEKAVSSIAEHLTRKQEQLRISMFDQILALRGEIAKLAAKAPEKAPEAAAGAGAMGAQEMAGMYVAIHQFQKVIEPLVNGIEQDVLSDRAMVQAIQENTAEVKALRMLVGEHVELLRQPKHRTGTVELPSGPVTMTITEQLGVH